jgi:hypothetical protein
MRPGYGLTNERTYHRIGTLLGGASLWYPNFVHDTTITAMLAIVAMLLGFTYTPSNYKIGATLLRFTLFYLCHLTPNTADGSVPHFRISLLELILSL